MPFPIRAITLDLDDTLWPIAPVMLRAEQQLDDWLRTHAPKAAERWPMAAMRQLRDRISEQHPHLAHDYTEQRRLTLAHAFAACGEDDAHVDAAFAAFYAARNQVQCYPDAIAALERIATHVPVAALTNGNADLEAIGLARHFKFNLGAREHGAAKPSACIFHAACARLDLEPAQVLHVGDDIEMDVVGAAQAGMRTCWINREQRAWPHADPRPDLEFDTLTALADWLDAHPLFATPQSTSQTAAA
ncbi:MAG: HAD-IA family hydrolase [Pseudomonadota bacterium]|nr:HAD-IA family hydrolase [Pseudomonadota bacterium]